MHWIYCLRSTSVIAKQRNSNFLPGERKSSYFWINKIFFFFSGETMTGMDNLGYDANTENAVSGWIFVINAELDHIKIPFLLLYYKLTNNVINIIRWKQCQILRNTIISCIYWSNLQLYIDRVFMQIWTGVECKFS